MQQTYHFHMDTGKTISIVADRLGVNQGWLILEHKKFGDDSNGVAVVSDERVITHLIPANHVLYVEVK